MLREDWPTCKYQLSAKAFIAPAPGKAARIVNALEVIEFDGKPGPHMIPLCDEGKAAKDRAGAQTTDPLRHLSLQHTPGAEDLVAALLDRLQKSDSPVKLPAAPAAVAAATPSVPPPPPPPKPRVSAA